MEMGGNMDQKRLGDLQKWEKNPRTITEAKKAQLLKTLEEFGDLSGIVFNVANQRLVGGHMRSEQLAEAEINITKTFDPPTKQGTVAIGQVEHNGETYSYREVNWDENKHAAGAIAANKGAGEWDLPLLKDLLKNLEENTIDMELTGFDFTELDSLLGQVNNSSDLDYSALGESDVSEDLDKMSEGLRKAIQIEFNMDDYPEAFELVSMFRAKGTYIGGMFLEFLRNAKGTL